MYLGLVLSNQPCFNFAKAQVVQPTMKFREIDVF